MAETTVEAETTDISPVVAEYKKWEKHGQKLAIDQALHPAVLNNIPWDVTTPGKIAEFALGSARVETLGWVSDRKELYILEKSEKYNKVREVRREIRKILRKEKV